MVRHQKPKVVWLLTHPIQYFVNLIDELHRRGVVEVAVIFANSGKGFHDKSFGRQVDWNSRPDGDFPSVVLPDASQRSLSGPLSTRSCYLTHELDRLQPDIIHLNSYYNAMQWQGYLWTRRNRVPYLFRGDGDLIAKRTGLFRPLRKLVFRPIVANAAVVFTQGRENSRFLLDAGATETQLKWVPCVSDSQRFRENHFGDAGSRELFRRQHGAEADDCVYVFCGKLIPRKRAMDVVQAMMHLRDIDCKVWFLGSGEEEGELRAETHRLGLDSSIHWLGFQSQDMIPKFLQAADVFVHPSQWDPWPYAVLDAASSGLPLILSDRTGCHSDWTADPCCAVAYPCGNVQALATVMRNLAVDLTTRLSLRKNALRHSSHHTEEEFCRIFENAISEQILKGTSKNTAL